MKNFNLISDDITHIESLFKDLSGSKITEPWNYENLQNMLDQFARHPVPNIYITVTHLDDRTHPQNQRRTVISGVQKLLGYSHDQFDFNKSINIICGIFKLMVLEHGKAAYELLKHPHVRSKINWDVHYSIKYLVQHQRGHTLPVTQTSMIIPSEDKEHFIAQLNFCFVHQHFPQEMIITKPVFSRASQLNISFEKEQKMLYDLAIPRILDRMKERNNNKSILTPKEFKIVVEYSTGLTATQIAEKEGFPAVDTIHRHCRNIMRKIKTWFPEEFNLNNIQKVAKYLKQLGFLDYPEQFK